MRVAPSSPSACLPALLSEDLGQVTWAGPGSNSGHLALQRWEPLRTERKRGPYQLALKHMLD